MKRRIVIITPARFPGTAGDTANYTELINQLALEKFEIWLICPRVSGEPSADAIAGLSKSCRIIRVPCEPPRLGQALKGLGLPTYLRFGCFHIAQLITVLSVFLRIGRSQVYMRHSILTLSLPILFKMWRIRVTADGELVHDSINSLNIGRKVIRLLRWYEIKVLHYYSVFKVSTRYHVEILKNLGIAESKILIFPMSINIENIPRIPIEKIPKDTFGYFGALEPWQGINTLLDSFRILVKRLPFSKLYIIGSGSLSNFVRETVDKYDLENNIVIVNAIPREKIWNEYFSRFRITVIPRPLMGNSMDSLPSVKLIEALAAAKPIITTSIPGMAELPTDSVMTVPADNTLSLAEAMEKLSRNESLLRRYSDAAASAAHHYDIRTNIKKLLEALQSDGTE
jgi:glycosyltransferase involved in cell wall biosynthesis